ncbi:amidase [Aspergillus sclerotioniger CBS 115572]|uniref:Amidase n=1 Tax=Aspergillus sclerotioniger CBS 115572 TaxID=1450535 RepID=A0A317X173_9EURO|nr:amidase [Aspergillus sclerotioniger CBS 115572]PWY91342.1 amidase [Aspergillus sclerotioniger CBS 115572]
MNASPTDWQTVGHRKRDEIQARIRPFLPADNNFRPPPAEELQDAREYARGYLDDTELHLTEGLTATELTERIADGQISAKQAVVAFCKRAAMAHQLTNCLSEVFFDDAIRRAEELDRHLASHGPVGPLHGLPVSLKDQFRVDGVETSLGYVSWLGQRDTETSESLIVQHLKAMGAVLYAKTNVPTSLMAMETNNNIIGYTVNPFNRLLSSAGSSGGEAALLAMRGSVIGLGSDFSASVRLPCSAQGLYGLKPSHGRLSYLRVANSMEGQDLNNSVIGIMGHDVDDLAFMTRSLLSRSPWEDDPKVAPIPWTQAKFDDTLARGANQRLTFGVLRCDGVVQPHPPVARAIEEVVQALQAWGHEVIEWSPPNHAEAFDILWNIFTSDGGRDIHTALQASGEDPIPQIAAVYGSKPGHLPMKSLHETWQISTRRNDFQTSYLRYWKSTAELTRTGQPVDFILMPTAPTASFRPGQALYPGYTGVVSILDLPAVDVPATRVQASQDEWHHRDEFFNDFDRQIWMQYDKNVFHNVPVGVQVVGRRLEEERVLAGGRLVAECLQKVS